METLLTLSKKLIDNIYIYHFEGELDETNADNIFTEIIDEMGDFENKNIILNLSGLTYMNSKSIGYMADILSRIEDVDSKMYLSNCTERVTDILTSVGLIDIIEHTNTEQEAIESIRN